MTQSQCDHNGNSSEFCCGYRQIDSKLTRKSEGAKTAITILKRKTK